MKESQGITTRQFFGIVTPHTFNFLFKLCEYILIELSEYMQKKSDFCFIKKIHVYLEKSSTMVMKLLHLVLEAYLTGPQISTCSN